MVSLWTGSKRFKDCEDLQWVVFICQTFFFFPNIYFHNFSVKHYLILYAKQNKSGSESSTSCLEQGSEMSNCCLKQGQGLKASVALSSAKTSLDCPQHLPTPLGSRDSEHVLFVLLSYFFFSFITKLIILGLNYAFSLCFKLSPLTIHKIKES